MSSKHRVLWHLKGLVEESRRNIGRKNRTYWQVIVKVEDGFVCAYVRKQELFLVAESLSPGQLIEASGVIRPHKEQLRSTGSVWLDPVDQLRIADN